MLDTTSTTLTEYEPTPLFAPTDHEACPRLDVFALNDCVAPLGETNRTLTTAPLTAAPFESRIMTETVIVVPLFFVAALPVMLETYDATMRAAVLVAVGIGIVFAVAVGTAVFVGLGVAVLVAFGVDVLVDAGEGVLLAVADGALVAVGFGVFVAIGVIVGVGVGEVVLDRTQVAAKST